MRMNFSDTLNGAKTPRLLRGLKKTPPPALMYLTQFLFYSILISLKNNNIDSLINKPDLRKRQREKQPMSKITIEDLQRIKEETLKKTGLRHQKPKARITVHMGESGIEAGGPQVMKALVEKLGQSGRHDIHLLAADSLEMTGSEPNVTVELEGQAPVIYQKMDPEKAALVFENHVLNGEIQQEYTIEIPAQEAGA